MASSVNLGEKLEATVDKLVKEGRYGSRSEVLRAGVRLVQEREAALTRFEAEIQKGLDDVAAGRVYPIEEVFEELKAKYMAMAERQRSAA
jgi:antitoxin ParD1/3/4